MMPSYFLLDLKSHISQPQIINSTVRIKNRPSSNEK
jgi:hypothetical protein